MKRIYSCPHCGVTLNPNVKIILRARVGDRHGLLLLSPQPGDYQVLGNDGLGAEPGEKVEFSCPDCHASLQSVADPNLAEIRFRDGATRTEGRIDFSRVFGEQATYVVTREQVKAYGQDSRAYDSVNFFGEGTGH